jgi:hypothetical protein
MICRPIWFVDRASYARHPVVWTFFMIHKLEGLTVVAVCWGAMPCGQVEVPTFRMILVPQSRCSTIFSVSWSWCFVTSREGWTRDGERWHIPACPVPAIWNVRVGEMFAGLLVHLRFVLLPFSTLCSDRHPQLARRQLLLIFLFDASYICVATFWVLEMCGLRLGWDYF